MPQATIAPSIPTTNLVQLQQHLHTLREEADTLADLVAEAAWDSFESDVEQATEDGYMFDLAASTQMMLASSLAHAYEQALQRHVQTFLTKLSPQLAKAAERVDLAGLRQSLELRSQANEMIGQAIDRAKPGLIGMLFLSNDPCSPAWEKEHQDNAVRLRRQLLTLQKPITAMIYEATLGLLHRARKEELEESRTDLVK